VKKRDDTLLSLSLIYLNIQLNYQIVIQTILTIQIIEEDKMHLQTCLLYMLLVDLRLRTTSTSYSGSTNTQSYSSSTNQYQSGNYSSDSYSRGNYSSADILGSWKHYNLSGATLNSRTTRAKSPLMDRELIRYYGKKPNYIGDVSSGAACDFRHYNYRRVPYFGGSDDYQFLRRKEYRGGRYT